MADSYPEDITSEAEEEIAGQTAEEAAEEEIDGGAKEEEQDDEAQAEEEQIPRNLHGYWVKCHVRNAHVQALENEGTMAPVTTQKFVIHFLLIKVPNFGPR
jgi:hypothetical protein